MISEKASINGVNGQVRAIFAASQQKNLNPAHNAISRAKSVVPAERKRNDSERSADLYARSAVSVILKPNRGGQYDSNLAALDTQAAYFPHMRWSLVAVNKEQHDREFGQSGCCTLL